MSADIITLNEVLNNGSDIYLYPEELTGCWVAFGYSAYLWSIMGDARYIANFSVKMQMSCVCIAEATFREFIKENVKDATCKDGYYRVSSASSVIFDAYQNWVASLKPNAL